ncbi:MAG: MerR family transcriptional regulator [Chloroflexota bacterium]|nr:MAG: MerR family transcriptional regulator [Chloroflexota bacterium]
MSLGEKIRTRREEIDISLRELAARTDLTHSFLSLVERDQADPSINSLRRIAEALGTPLANFFTEDNEVTPLVKRSQRRTLRLPGSHIEYEMLNPTSIRRLQFFMTNLEPGAATADEPISHPVEECTVVLQGRLKLEVGSEVYILEEGDSAGWDGNQPHRLSCVGEDTLVLISATSPPMF